MSQKNSSPSVRDRARGMLVGLAVGDALGVPVEFGYTSQSIAALGDKIEHFQPSPLGPAGTWTDDTSMALCLADSLIEKNGYDSFDIMAKYRHWMLDGYRTCDGFPAADVGIQTRIALMDFANNPYIDEDAPKTESAGNGAIMRLAPIVLAAMQDSDSTASEERDLAIKLARLSCRETHDSYMAIAVTEAFATLLMLCLFYKNNFGSAVGHCTCWLSRNEKSKSCPEEIDHARTTALESKDGAEFKDRGGYILDAFAIAIWGVTHSKSFEEGMINVIRLGGDTDTNAAIYGQLAGVYYGYSGIPEEWREGVYSSAELVEIADKLLDMKECPVIRTRFKDEF